MEEEITLGVRGDVNLLRNRFSAGMGRSLPIHVTGYDESEDTYYITIALSDGLKETYLGLVAEYIIERYEGGLISRILTEEHSYLTAAQRREVLRGISRLADDKTVGYHARKTLVTKCLTDYFARESEMLVDGFVQFRLKAYIELLEDLADRLIDDYLVQKEYEEFLSLLQYFVKSQRVRPPLVHVVVLPSGRYRVIDDKDRDVTGTCMSEMEADGEDLRHLTPDDLLISILISIAPLSVVVHNKRYIQNIELFTTIAKVFDGNITYCNGCSMCTAADKRPSAPGAIQPTLL